MPKQKKKRAHKVSQGLRKHSKHPLSAVQKVLLGKGQFQSTEPVAAPSWKGAQQPSYPVFDREQVEINKKAYPHLFRGN